MPFQSGANGHGGLPEDFDTTCHGLQKLRIETLNGVIFGTFAEDTKPLAAFLDTLFVEQIARLFHKPVKVLGYQRQRIFGNWKLYTDNLRDPNHGGLLHMFQITFGIARLSQKGGAWMDREHKHNMSWAAQGGRTEDEKAAQGLYGETQRGDMDIKLRDPSLLRYEKEFPDDQTLSILSIFPNAAFQQISNTLAIRQFRTSSTDEFEIVSTFFGYADDDDAMTRHRLRQANLAGPAGLVSMEDGEAVELVHRASTGVTNEYVVVEFGGRGAIEDQETLITDVPVRGFWQHYCRLMGIAPGAEPVSAARSLSVAQRLQVHAPIGRGICPAARRRPPRRVGRAVRRGLGVYVDRVSQGKTANRRPCRLSLMLCDNKDMVSDRISSLREANIYNIHTDRHILSLPRCTVAATGKYDIQCAYALYQSNQEGRSWLFSVGRYQHRIVEKNGRLLFRHTLVVVDTGAVPTLLAVPI